MKQNQGGADLRLRVLMLAGCLALMMSPLATVTGSADTVSALVTQRQALQRQVGSLGGTRAAAVAGLVQAQSQLNSLRAELAANSARLDDLNHRQAALHDKIRATQSQIDAQKLLLAALTRSQYKQASNDESLQMLFGSGSFSQLMGSWMTMTRVSRNISETERGLKLDEASLRRMSADLARDQAAAGVVQAQLQQENGRLLAQVADFDAHVAGIDGQSQALLSQIAQVNRSIVAAQTPAPRYGGAGSSCGNHFDFGYCTWYVATRRCIPWFGNADEWYANARAYGYPEGQAAAVGAVAVWGASGYSSVGHVAYVESVQSDGFTVSEMNYNGGWDQRDTRFIPNSNRGPAFQGFIYGK